MNRPAWKQERMVISFAGRFFDDVARASFGETIDLTEREVSGVSITATNESSTSETEQTSDIDVCEVGGSENCGAGSEEKRGKKRKRDRPVLDSPLNLYITQCPDCEKITMAGKDGDRVEVERSLLERALCDGAVHEVDKHGLPGWKKRSVSPALRKKIFMRDGGVCRVPGCGATSFLEVHHVKPLSKKGGNDPSNLILTCGLCHKNIHEGRLLVNGSHPDFDFLHMGKIDMINRRHTRREST